VLTLAALSAAAIAAIWLGYPLAVALVGALRPVGGAGRAAGGVPTVTAVVASRDDAEAIRARVADLLASDYDPARLDVVVALDAAGAAASPAGLVWPLEEAGRVAGRVTVVCGDAPGGKAATLNAGVRAARGELLVFTDTGQRFHRDAVARLVAALADPRFGAASGSLDIGHEVTGEGGPPTLAERYWRYERWLRREEARVHSAVGVTGAVYAMRRALWTPLPAGLILDDLYVPMRLVLDGHRVGFTDEARAVDTRRFAAAQEYRRKVRTLTGVIQLCAWLPAVLVPVRNPIWAQFLFHKLLRLVTPYLALGAVLGAAGAAVSVVAARAGEAGTMPLTGLAVVLVLAVLLVPAVRRRVAHQLEWGVSLQAAVVVATVNGLRGRWNVWQR
jgi:cellulose synthase/poly-beta-1,6-N-acetylglucosamine synthase-like glycosyltransferase